MIVAIVLFGIAALGGAFLAVLRFQKKPLPLGVAVLHGILAASGLVVLLTSVISAASTGSLPKVALGLFIVAALGGFGLFSFHLRKKDLPIPLVLVHAVVAVAGFLSLVAAVAGI
jgi:hypothetical protein